MDGHFLENILQMRLRSEVGATTPEQSVVYTTAIGTPTRHELDTTVVIVQIINGASINRDRM